MTSSSRIGSLVLPMRSNTEPTTSSISSLKRKLQDEELQNWIWPSSLESTKKGRASPECFDQFDSSWQLFTVLLPTWKCIHLCPDRTERTSTWLSPPLCLLPEWRGQSQSPKEMSTSSPYVRSGHCKESTYLKCYDSTVLVVQSGKNVVGIRADVGCNKNKINSSKKKKLISCRQIMTDRSGTWSSWW